MFDALSEWWSIIKDLVRIRQLPVFFCNLYPPLGALRYGVTPDVCLVVYLSTFSSPEHILETHGGGGFL